jgi:hypothetical protein
VNQDSGTDDRDDVNAAGDILQRRSPSWAST